MTRELGGFFLDDGGDTSGDWLGVGDPYQRLCGRVTCRLLCTVDFGMHHGRDGTGWDGMGWDGMVRVNPRAVLIMLVPYRMCIVHRRYVTCTCVPSGFFVSFFVSPLSFRFGCLPARN